LPHRLYHSPEEKDLLESRNVLLLADEVKNLFEESQAGTYSLTPIVIRHFQSIVVKDIYACAGGYRTPDQKVIIQGSEHSVPIAIEVPALVQEMCNYVNTGTDKTPIHHAAYVLWRVNWIHPFAGGNGRTARAASYLVLCAKLGFWLPGTKTIAQHIEEDRKPYYDALRAGDIAFKKGAMDVSAMEELISALLAKQLLAIHDLAGGSK
jgi:Fic family protein